MTGMVDIDGILARARLRPATPCTQSDIEAGERRVAARVAARLAGAAPPPARPRTPTIPPGYRHLASPAARNLRALCQAVLNRPDAIGCLEPLSDSRVPEPDGARVLACILYLAACEDSARFWWQYAAGAGDQVAAYSLYLHHQSMGEDDDAEWWYDLTTATPATLDESSTRAEIATALHVLAALHHAEPLSEHIRALIEYIPALIGHPEDVELPLPTQDFGGLMGAFAFGHPPTEPRSSGPLPERRHHCSPHRKEDGNWIAPTIRSALEACDRALTC